MGSSSTTVIYKTAPFSKWELAGFSLLSLLAAALVLVSLVPEWRDSAHSQMRPSYRKLLSKASGDFLRSGIWLDIVKVETEDGLFVEVYSSDNKQNPQLVERLRLSGNRDAFFHSHGAATRMVIEDLDGTGRPEIVVPSFDDDLVAHINVFRLLENGQTQQVASNRERGVYE